MSKFNNKTQTNKPNTKNMAGGEAFTYKDIRQEIVSLVLNAMLAGKNSFYETEKDRINKIINFVKNNKEEAEFLAKAMVFARNEGNLRSVSHILGATLVENVKGVDFLRPALYKTLVRPDDALEMVSLFLSRNKDVKVPNVLQRSIVDAFESKWDEYQLKKYASLSKELKLKDLVKMFRPNPNNLVALGKAKDTNVFKRLIEDRLENIDTAQTINSTCVGKDRKKAYKELLKDNKLGYMAALKNIMNMLEVDIGEKTVDRLCNLLTNERAVLNSRVLPFRFVQAYNELDSNRNKFDTFKVKAILDALEKGFALSSGCINIANKNEKVALLLDESSSMGGSGDKTPFTIGKTLMASMLCGLDKKNVVGYLWATTPREVSIDKSPMKFVKETFSHGGGTDLKSAFKSLIDKKTKVDKIVIFTDKQGYSCTASELKDYVNKYKAISPNVKILFWNLEGYAQGTPLKLNDDILEISGYSDKILEVIPYIWENKDALVEKIESIKLS